MWASASSISVNASLVIEAAVSCAWARTNIATSVATWSLRERAVWSLPPTSPTSSVSRRSIAMWMSSSPSANGNEPSVSSCSICSMPRCSGSRSSAPMIPRAASIDACARDCSTSYGPSRQSNPIESFRPRKVACWGSATRDTAAILGRRGEMLRPQRPYDLAERLSHTLDLPVCQPGEEGQRDRTSGDVLTDRKLALAMPESLAVEAHQVDRRQVRLALNAALAQRADRCVAVDAGGELNHEHEPATAVAADVRARQLQLLDVSERLAVARCHSVARGEHRVEALQPGQARPARDLG